MTVRVYRSTDYGAPSLTGQVGSLTALLDKCLVDGYGDLGITSLTQVGGVATAVCANPHGYVNSPKVTISGADQAGYNGEFTATVTSSTTFTFPVVGSTVSPATGIPTVRRGGSGWSKPFGGTSISVYKQPAGTNGFYMRVDDASTANIARVLGYETMANVNDTTGSAFPSTALLAGGVYAMKSTTTDGTIRPWILATNGKIIYLFMNQDSTANWLNAPLTIWGDGVSNKSGDQFCTVSIGGSSSSISSNVFSGLPNAAPLSSIAGGHFIARSHTQLGAAVTLGKTSDYGKTGSSTIGGGGMTYPSPVDGGLHVAPIWLVEPSLSVVRGKLPGIWNPLHTKPLSNGDVWVATGDLAGKTFEALNIYSNGQLFLETSDTW